MTESCPDLLLGICRSGHTARRAGGAWHCLRTAPKVALSCSVGITRSFEKYSHEEKKLSGFFLGVVLDMYNFYLRPRNNPTGDVYCLRRRNGLGTAQTREFAEITSEVPTVLPYLGPEIIAVMQAACNASPNDSRSGPGLPFPSKIDGRIIPFMVLSRNLSCSDSRIVGGLNIWLRWRP